MSRPVQPLSIQLVCPESSPLRVSTKQSPLSEQRGIFLLLSTSRSVPSANGSVRVQTLPIKTLSNLFIQSLRRQKGSLLEALHEPRSMTRSQSVTGSNLGRQTWIRSSKRKLKLARLNRASWKFRFRTSLIDDCGFVSG